MITSCSYSRIQSSFSQYESWIKDINISAVCAVANSKFWDSKMHWKIALLNNKKYTYEYFCQSNVCRLCWSRSNNTKPIKNEPSITERVLEYIGIDITQGIPKTVCSNCISEIDSFIDFKEFCKEADSKLSIILSNKSLQNDYKVKLEENSPTILCDNLDPELHGFKKEKKPEELFQYDVMIKQETVTYNIEMEDAKSSDDNLSKEALPKEAVDCYPHNSNLDSTEQEVEHNEEFQNNEAKFYECNGCNKRFANLARKKNHDELHLCKAKTAKTKLIKKQKNIKKAKTNSTKVINKQNNNKFHCKICGKFLPTQKVLESHMRIHNKSTQKANCVEIKKSENNCFQCKKCSESFQFREDLKNHMTTHKNQTEFICETCGKIFKKRLCFRVHLLIHTNPKQLKCLHCDYRATHPSSLRVHKRLHTGERPYACDQCPYTCVTSSNMSKHRRHHMDVRDFKCHLCTKEYKNKQDLQDHITITHEGIKQHTCKQCGTQYYRFEHLRRHNLKKHGQRIRKDKGDYVEIDEGTYRRRNQVEKEKGTEVSLEVTSCD